MHIDDLDRVKKLIGRRKILRDAINEITTKYSGHLTVINHVGIGDGAHIWLVEGSEERVTKAVREAILETYRDMLEQIEAALVELGVRL